MTKEEALQIWTPPQSRWSQWVKAILFAFMDGQFAPSRPRSLKINLDWAPKNNDTAIILNLSREDGVFWGIELAKQHYQPIPLYNALPFPPDTKMTPRSRPVATVVVEPILAALYEESAVLQKIRLPNDAPPAFLLDADREIALADPVAGVFENRSVCFPTDFPSPDFLIACGIRKAILVQNDNEIAHDLNRVLLPWQESGIQIFRKSPHDRIGADRITVKRVSTLRSAWERLRIIFGLRRGELGGFGGTLSSSGG